MGEGLYKFNHEFLNKFVNVHEVFFEDVGFVTHRGHAESHFSYKAYLRGFIYAARVRQAAMAPNDWKKILLGDVAYKKMFNDTRAENAKVNAFNVGKGKGEKMRARPMGKIYVCNKLIEMGWKNGEHDTDKNHDEADAIGVAFALMKKRNQELKFSA